MKINLKQEHTLNTYMSSEKPHSLQRINIIYNTYTRLADTHKKTGALWVLQKDKE